MKRFLIIISLLTGGLLSVCCSSFDEMNRNPYAIYDAPSESYVQSILYKTEYTILRKCYDLVPQLMQYAVSTNYDNSALLPYNYVIDESNASTLWGLYTQYGNAVSMLAVAKEEANPAMEGVALILRTFIMQVITDTYGDVPYSQAGQLPGQTGNFSYDVPYDSQKDIYIDMLRSLERANRTFVEADEKVGKSELSSADFNAFCDYMYKGNVEKWRRFGNSLYLRLLMRISLKAIEENGGEIDLGDDYGVINVPYKIAEIYDGFINGNGNYPVINTIENGASVGFSSTNSNLYTPFYSTTSGVWRGMAACETLVNRMVHKEGNNVVREDPRLYFYFHKPMGAPVQITKADMQKFFEEQVTSLGNSRIGRYPNGGDGQLGDLQNGDSYALLNFSEVLFMFAEAGVRGWTSASATKVKELYLDACEASMREWNPNDLVKDGSSMTRRDDYLLYLEESYDAEKALEEIMTQKWIASFWVGIESWADYRRTGYPILKTNGPAAENKNILCTRMRYPATEAYQNSECYEAAVNGWLNGTDNMQTDMWWADTEESKNIRRKGRQ